MKKILCLVGPTGVGKTALALTLSQHLPCTLISADSRQVYRGMDIVTGKDHLPGTKLLGIDLVDPDESCSVSLWFHAVRGELTGPLIPLIVGGTGLYIRAAVEGIATINILPDLRLRRELSSLSLLALQKKVSSAKLLAMNYSDRNNPRRLVRAIEVANSVAPPYSHPHYDACYIGLRYYSDTEYQRAIKARVLARIEEGAIDETKYLLAKFSKDLPSMTALGYKHLVKYLNGELTRSKLVDSWVSDELAYAKRQLTWFNRVGGITWYDAREISQNNSVVVNQVETWYHKGGNERNTR